MANPNGHWHLYAWGERVIYVGHEVIPLWARIHYASVTVVHGILTPKTLDCNILYEVCFLESYAAWMWYGVSFTWWPPGGYRLSQKHQQTPSPDQSRLSWDVRWDLSADWPASDPNNACKAELNLHWLRWLKCSLYAWWIFHEDRQHLSSASSCNSWCEPALTIILMLVSEANTSVIQTHFLDWFGCKSVWRGLN